MVANFSSLASHCNFYVLISYADEATAPPVNQTQPNEGRRKKQIHTPSKYSRQSVRDNFLHCIYAIRIYDARFSTIFCPVLHTKSKPIIYSLECYLFFFVLWFHIFAFFCSFVYLVSFETQRASND